MPTDRYPSEVSDDAIRNLRDTSDGSVARLYAQLALGEVSPGLPEYADEGMTVEHYLTHHYNGGLRREDAEEIMGQTRESARRWCAEAIARRRYEDA